MIGIRFPLLTGLAFFSLVSLASAACELELQRIDDATWARSGGYDVFDPVAYGDRFSFDILHQEPDGEPCDALVTVAPTATARLDGPRGASLLYEIRADAGSPGDPRGISFVFELQPGERRQVSYFILLPASQFAASGPYEGSLTISLTEDLDGSLQERDRSDIPMRATVGSGAEISFVGAIGQRQTIDLGELTDGKSSPEIFLDVQSTGDYEISLTSEEGGQLVQRVDGRDWDIPYRAILDGSSIDLRGRDKARRRFPGPTDPAGKRLPIQFQLEAVGDQRAGVYRDRITIEITPTL